MVDPYKHDWTGLKIFAAGGVLVVLFLAISSTQTLTTIAIFELLGIFLLLSTMGAMVDIATAEYLHTQVAHPVAPIDLVIGQRYWLNGQTWADYKGQNNFTGLYIFEVYGIKKPVELFPGQVLKYISSQKD